MNSNMFSFKVVLLAVALLAVTVQSWSDGNLSGSELTRLYESPVYYAEKMIRPLDSWSFMRGKLCHSGVRVTLGDGSRWLIHKGPNYGVSTNTVVTRAYMSSKWEVSEAVDFQGRKTVADFVEAGGSDYKLFSDNCHSASGRMMDLYQ